MDGTVVTDKLDVGWGKAGGGMESVMAGFGGWRFGEDADVIGGAPHLQLQSPSILTEGSSIGRKVQEHFHYKSYVSSLEWWMEGVA